MDMFSFDTIALVVIALGAAREITIRLFGHTAETPAKV